MNEIDQVKIEELIKLLKLMKLRPASGYGKTIIRWVNSEIVLMTKVEKIKP